MGGEGLDVSRGWALFLGVFFYECFVGLRVLICLSFILEVAEDPILIL